MEVAAAAANYVADVDNNCLKATELRLGLPGTEETTAVLPTPPSTPRGKKREGNSGAEEAAKKRDGETAPPAAKAQVVGWPPVRSYRKSCFQQSSGAKSKPAPAEEKAPAPAAPSAAAAGGNALFVKVSMDGAPYLRKIDLKMYKGYRELREALEAMFLCFSGGADAPAVNPSDFAVTYEDKDGDLMLVGDVPFDMFISTCKRLRIMKGSEARGLGSVKNN
ncbi:Auxin-responsive protein IAA31 [Dichanthelium oligosanthes]|uniref:Auxin-responsive protein n=1 Tax=Dichanthelium oligosanthes TaxID=888268 RepID=A0A1E5W1B4_9POAL|nr:Auxin-responsive protein IAA31 [Dichanthelium oligosanthes]